MRFLVEIDHSRSSPAPTPEVTRAFIEQVIFPAPERAEALLAENRIVARGPVAGRIALRLMIEATRPHCSISRIRGGAGFGERSRSQMKKITLSLLVLVASLGSAVAAA